MNTETIRTGEGSVTTSDIPGWEGTIGPSPAQYGAPHVYARDVHSGAGNCVCGRALRNSQHVQAAPGVPIPADSEPNGRSVLAEVAAERVRQDKKWGEQNHPDGTGQDVVWVFTGPASHVADSVRKCVQAAAREGTSDWAGILLEELAEAFAEDDPVRLREELIQVAAVATQWVEAIDRRAVQDRINQVATGIHDTLGCQTSAYVPPHALWANVEIQPPDGVRLPGMGVDDPSTVLIWTDPEWRGEENPGWSWDSPLPERLPAGPVPLAGADGTPLGPDSAPGDVVAAVLHAAGVAVSRDAEPTAHEGDDSQ